MTLALADPAAQAAGPPPHRRGGAPRARAWRALRPYLYIAPAALTFLIWIYEPLAQAFWLSFHQWNLLPTSPKLWVGWENFRNILDLPQFWQALDNTWLYLAGLLPMTVAAPLAVAIFTQDLPARARNLYRALIFAPMIVPPVVAAAVWRWLLDPRYGVVNSWIEGLGFDPVKFLADPSLALWTITFITGWKLIGFATLILSAANAAIDPSLIEAARLDGASRWRIVRDIRLPLLSPAILLLAMMVILLGAQWSFAYIHVLTEGGPLGATTNIYYLLWQFGFASLSVGWSSASAVILFLGFGVLAAVSFWLKSRLSFHED